VCNTAVAKNRKFAADLGISTDRASPTGFPVSIDSIRESRSRFASIRSASFNNRLARSVAAI
jgi:hypothetical protein